MSQEIEVINPLHFPGWEEWVLSTGNYSFFHSSNWARVLQESYGYRPAYFGVREAGRLQAVIACMEIESIFTGKRGVSLPFTDHCEPLMGAGASEETVSSLVNRVFEYGKKAGWDSVELRCELSPSRPLVPSSTYYSHPLDLSKKEEALLSAFRDSTKRNIRKAMKEGVQAGIFNSLDSVRDFYRLHCLTRKEHGLPPQPFRFFEKIHEHVLAKGKGWVVLASYRGGPIAGAVYFHFGEAALYKYGASDKRYQHLRGNNLVMWEAIKWYVRSGYKRFCFGRTESGNHGLLQYKRGWGAAERTLRYHKYDMKRASFIREADGLSTRRKRIFHRMPIPLLKWTGSMLYKHIG